MCTVSCTPDRFLPGSLSSLFPPPSFSLSLSFFDTTTLLKDSFTFISFKLYQKLLLLKTLIIIFFQPNLTQTCIYYLHICKLSLLQL